MKKEKFTLSSNSLLYYAVFGILVIVISFILYPLFDWIICTVFTRSPFVYSIRQHIVNPAITGIFTTIALFVMNKISKKKDNNKDNSDKQ